MLKFIILGASFSAIALGSFMFVRGGETAQTDILANAEFVSAPVEFVEPPEKAVVTGQIMQATSLPSRVEVGENASLLDTLKIVEALRDVPTAAKRPAPRENLVLVAQAEIGSNDAPNTANQIVMAGIAVNAAAQPMGEAPSPAPFSLNNVVARSLANAGGGTYVAALVTEAKDTRTVAPTTGTMFENTLISANHSVTLAAVQATNSDDSAYISQLSEASAPPKRVITAIKHTVRRGDNLMKLSYIYYGRTSDYAVIFQANRDKIKNPDRIRIGQKLVIPAL